MKKLILLGAIVFVMMALVVPVNSLAEEEKPKDSQVEGLWLTIPGLPEDAYEYDFRTNEQGAVVYTRMLPGGGLVIIGRVPVVDEGGETITPETLQDWVAGSEGTDKSAIQITHEEELSALYSYPTYTAHYSKGEGDDLRNNLNLYMFTDKWVLMVMINVAYDFEDDYQALADDWFKTMELRD